MKRSTIWVIALMCSGLLAVVGPACDGESLGGVISSLTGEYRIPDSDCWVKISGSSVTAVDGDGQSPCVDEENWGDVVYSETLSIEGTISEDSIVVTMVYTEAFEETWEDCQYLGSESYTFDLDVSKSKGKQASGKLAALAGDWEGWMSLEEAEQEEIVAGPDCPEDSDSWSWDDTIHFEIEAQIDGKQAEIRFREEGDDWEEFDVEAEGDDVEVDGEDIEVK